LSQLAELGFVKWDTWGEAAPGVPFYLFGHNGLALYQIRAGVAERNSFGPLSDRHLATLAQLRARFFPGRSEDELLPPVEPLGHPE
jgi:hypothetical protein